jgi:hypothetical protein
MKEDVSWWNYNLSIPASYTRCIKQLMKICRYSIEYDYWQRMTKAKADSNACPICNVEYIYVRAESHHHPKQMFTVIEDILQEHIHNNTIDDIEPLELVKKIMALHLEDRVEHIVLCKACHQKFHSYDPVTVKRVSEYLKSKKEAEEWEQVALEAKEKEAVSNET